MATRPQERLAIDAAAFLAKNENTVESLSGSPSEIKRQAFLLIDWAKERDVLLSEEHVAGLEKFETPSTEHEVYLRTSDRRVVKCTFPGSFGHVKDSLNGKPRKSTPLNYLRRLNLMNEIFGDDIVLEGVALGVPRGGDGKEKLPYLIVSQGFIEAVDESFREPTEREISDFMEMLGFGQLSDSVYQWYRESDDIIICDAKPANFIRSHQGVVPVDLLISKKYS